MKQSYNTVIYNAALYMRLSRDDDTYGDSVSIESQRMILTKYAKINGLRIVDEYIDDGFSGTNFERPAFQRMISDVKSGKVNCIVTKDLSRFGREHIQMDYYLEFLFPNNNIRFIAVTENEDTKDGLSDFVPFKNLFNEWYAKDTSRKIKSTLKAKYEAGQYLCTSPPLGYKKDSCTKNKLIIDNNTSWIIKKIFDLAYQGFGRTEILKILISEKIPTPSWFSYQNLGLFSNIYGDCDSNRKYKWRVDTITEILKNEVYIGNSIHYKRTAVSYKNKKICRNSPDKWMRLENTHEPIIDKDLFYSVQEKIKTRRKSNKHGKKNIFSGLLFCSDCGNTLTLVNSHINKSNRNGEIRQYDNSYYRCNTYGYYSYNTDGKAVRSCTMHYINYETLYAYVLSRLQFWSKKIQLDEEWILEQISGKINKKENKTRNLHDKEIKKTLERKKEVDNLFIKLYEDWATGCISEYNYKLLSKKYQNEQEQLDYKIHKLQGEQDFPDHKVENIDKWINLMKKYVNPSKLTSELLNILIEKIIIHEKETDNDGKKFQEIEIFYRFVGKIG